MTFQEQVHRFHGTFGFHIGQLGEVPPLEVRKSRAMLLWQETRELLTELLADDPESLLAYGIEPPGEAEIKFTPQRGHEVVWSGRPVDPVKVAHETTDVHVVVTGAAVNFGFDETPVFDEVMAANMRKVGEDGKPLVDRQGKAVKPPGFVPADVASVMRPFADGTANADAAARWLAEQSQHPLYQDAGWRLLLKDPSKVEHATRCAIRRTPGQAETVTACRDVLHHWIRSQQ